MPDSQIVEATIAPIRARDLRNFGALIEPDEDEDENETTVRVPIAWPVGVHQIGMVQAAGQPIELAPASLAHAHEVAKRVIALADRMPVNELSADILAMALALEHHAAKGPRT